ncbi:MAG TPA: hypothetical protein VHD63_12745 [Ktedonobacteraceae bacterium]|nr:hypothetical protein [Ktedonobacteraceae bacterium]
MTDSEQSGNLYARELVQILAEHGLKLADLVKRVNLDPATVERLHLSLTDPRLTPVLTPEEQEGLVTGLFFNATEQRRLLAALMATAIQRLLKDQLGLTSAHQFAEQAYPFLLAASLQADLETLGEGERIADHGSREDQTWQAIWDAIEAAALASRISHGRGLSSGEQQRHLREAQGRLEEAMADLERLKATRGTAPTWQTCHKKASQDLRVVTRRLRQLETR